MSTYIVEIDSTFRDLNKFPTQTDFSVTFKENLTTDYQVQGLPISYTGDYDYYNNFFTRSSIDPDYSNSNLFAVNGLLLDIQRSDESFYLSGIAFQQTSSTGFSICNNSGALVSYTGVNTLSPYLCKLTLINNTYVFNWLQIAVGSLTGASLYDYYNPSILNETPYTSRSVSRISNQGGVFWMFDFNYSIFDIYSKTSNSTSTLYSSISPSTSGAFTNNMLAIFAFTEEGSIYKIDNRPWGYHILSSDFRFYSSSVDSENATQGFEIDDAQNLYVNGNLNSYYYQFNFQVATGPNVLNAFIYPNGFPNTVTTIQIYVTGAPGSETGGTGTLKEYVLMQPTCNPYKSRLVGFSSNPNDLESFQWKYNSDLGSSITGTVYTDLGSCQFFNYNSNIYLVQTITPIGNNMASLFPMYIFRIDPISGTPTLLATSSSLFNSSRPGVVVLGTTAYISIKSNNSTLYMYTFNLVTNVLTLSTSLSYSPSSNVAIAITLMSNTTSDPDKLTILIPDNDFLNLTPSTNQLIPNYSLFSFEYSISSNAFTLKSSLPFSLYNNLTYGQLYKIKNRWYYFAFYSIFNDIFDVTDLTNMYKVNTFQFRNLKGACVFEYTESGVTNYYVSINQGGFYGALFNITDVNNIILLTDHLTNKTDQYKVGNIDNTYYFFNTINSYGYSYAGGYTLTLTGIYTPAMTKLVVPVKKPTIYSRHYYQNEQTILTLNSQNYSQVRVAYTEKTTNKSNGLLFTSDLVNLYVYKINDNLISITLINTVPFPSPLLSIPFSI
jgi:hypothetical protein